MKEDEMGSSCLSFCPVPREDNMSYLHILSSPLEEEKVKLPGKKCDCHPGKL